MKMKFIIFGVLLCASLNVSAQVATSDPVYADILKMDSIIFEDGFNQCQLDAFEGTIADDLEFYHDQGGIMLGKEAFVDGIKNNICSIHYRPLRKLNAESTEIYLMKSEGEVYGVIQMGEHEFYAIEENKEPYLTSTALFSHLWLKQGDSWILKRVLSFNHQTPEQLQ